MLTGRDADHCPHLLQSPETGKRICQLAGRILGLLPQQQQLVGVDVTRDACDACCRCEQTGAESLNPVLASIVYTAADQQLTQPFRSAMDHVRCREAQEFVLPWIRDQESSVSADQCSVSVFSEKPDSGSSSSDGWRNVSRRALSPKSVDRRLCVGLVGCNSAYGLGQMNRDLVAELKIDRWLMPYSGQQLKSNSGCRLDVVSHAMIVTELRAWLSGLDVVVFVESPVFPLLTSVARQMGVRVICIPMWEWLHPGLKWLPDVDLMLCPVRYAAERLQEWKDRFQFSWILKQIEWPIDISHFIYRNRRVCRRFVFVNGTGGYSARRLNQESWSVRRKGLETFLQAAEQLPGIPMIVYADSDDVSSCSSNVEVRSLPVDNRLLYADGDVCVQPSHWEGLGLPLLECQASGMPLISTTAPPMNEHSPMKGIPISASEPFCLSDNHCLPAALMDPVVLADTLRSVFGTNISRASRRARLFVERRHSWQIAGPKIAAMLGEQSMH